MSSPPSSALRGALPPFSSPVIHLGRLLATASMSENQQRTAAQSKNCGRARGGQGGGITHSSSLGPAGSSKLAPTPVVRMPATTASDVAARGGGWGGGVTSASRRGTPLLGAWFGQGRAG